MISCISLTTYADKQEWYDNNYDFTKAKAIVFRLWMPEDFSDLASKEIADIYFGQIKTEIYDKLNTKCKIVSWNKVTNYFLRDTNMTESEFADMEAKDPQKLYGLVEKYIADNYDLCVTGRPLIYDIGSQYCEGYIYTLPSVNTSLITFPNGQMATVSSTGQTVHSVPGGNFPTVYVSFRFDVTNAKTLNSKQQNVWSRLDDRARVNRDILQNTKPKDVLKRIMNSFSEDFVKVINTKKGTKPKGYGF